MWNRYGCAESTPIGFENAVVGPVVRSRTAPQLGRLGRPMLLFARVVVHDGRAHCRPGQALSAWTGMPTILPPFIKRRRPVNRLNCRSCCVQMAVSWAFVTILQNR